MMMKMMMVPCCSPLRPPSAAMMVMEVMAVCCLTAAGESSTGTHQNLAGLGDVCKKTGTLLLVDAVCSLGGVPVFADDWYGYGPSHACIQGLLSLQG